MKAIAKHRHHDREGMVALLILVTIVLLYLAGMYLWIRYEMARPVSDWHVHDIVGNAVGYQLGRRLYARFFKHDKG